MADLFLLLVLVGIGWFVLLLLGRVWWWCVMLVAGILEHFRPIAGNTGNTGNTRIRVTRIKR